MLTLNTLPKRKVYDMTAGTRRRRRRNQPKSIIDELKNQMRIAALKGDIL